MKQHIELGIMVAMAAMMVFATTAYVMPSVYAATSSSGKGGDSGKGDNAGSPTTGGGTSHPPSTYKACNPSNCKGTPGYYTTSGHHHCFDGSPGCTCTDPHKCTVGSDITKPGSASTKPGSAKHKARVI